MQLSTVLSARRCMPCLSRKGYCRTCLLGAGLSSDHQQQAGAQQVEGYRRPEAACDPEPDQCRLGKGAGCEPTPMPFAEVYGGLEQKTIDGQENPIGVIAANKFWEVQFISPTISTTHAVRAVQQEGLGHLSAAEKKILDDAAHESTLVQRKESRAQVAEQSLSC